MLRYVLGAAASAALALSLATPVSAQSSDVVEESILGLVEEVAALGEARAFTPDPTVDFITDAVGFEPIDAVEALDEIQFTEETNELLLSELAAAVRPPSEQVIFALDYSPDGIEQSIMLGQAEFLDPSPWLAALTDLIRRGGYAPNGPRDASERSVIPQLIDAALTSDDIDLASFADPTFEPPGAARARDQATTDSPDVKPPAAQGSGPAVKAPATSVEPQNDSAPDGASPSPFVWIGAAIVALALMGTIGFLMRRNRRPADATTPDHSGPGLSEVLDTSRRMTAALDAVSIAEIAVTDAVRLTNSEAGALVLREGSSLAVAYSTNDELFHPIQPDAGALARVVETGQPTMSVTQDDPGLARLPVALAASPVVVGGNVIGAIAVLRAATNTFTDNDANALKLLAPVTGSALTAARTHDSAVRTADVDGLTHLHNRRRLDRDLSGVGGRTGTFGFAMIDVDHFKNFNDTNGHGAGDIALQSVARAISGAVRETDVVYRYGGEEFSVMLGSCTSEQAVDVLERVRAAVEATNVPGDESQPLGTLTISVGVAVAACADAAATPKLADDALYEAKESGRNQVRLHS